MSLPYIYTHKHTHFFGGGQYPLWVIDNCQIKRYLNTHYEYRVVPDKLIRMIRFFI